MTVTCLRAVRPGTFIETGQHIFLRGPLGPASLHDHQIDMGKHTIAAVLNMSALMGLTEFSNSRLL